MKLLKTELWDDLAIRADNRIRARVNSQVTWRCYMQVRRAVTWRVSWQVNLQFTVEK